MDGMPKPSIIQKNASIGIGAMIVFIALVLTAGIAATVIIQTAGTLEFKGMDMGRKTTADVATSLHVTDIEGHYNTRSMAYNSSDGLIWNITAAHHGNNLTNKSWYNLSRIHNITITVTPRAGSMDIDLSHMLLELSNSSVKTILEFDSDNYANSVGNSGIFATNAFDLLPNKFGIIELEDADNSCDSTSPVLNRGDRIMITVNASACFWGLDSQEDVWGLIVLEDGAATPFSFRVPYSLSDAVYDIY